jgi:uncharacterized protein YjbI with pentapeptide repeats
LNRAFLFIADLRETDPSDADLSNADLSNADLSGAHLNGIILSGANLSRAVLSGADLRIGPVGSLAFLLKGAEPIGVNLSDADLSGANLSGVKGPTSAQLEEQVRSLKGATLPNDQKYEDWLKSKDRSEGEEDSSP